MLCSTRREPRHFHVALKLTCLARFLPLTAALRQRAGLASHWSTSHTEWWSVVRCGAFTTEHKASVDLTPLEWYRECQPVTGPVTSTLWQEAARPS